MAQSRILNQGGNPYSGGAVILDSTPYTQYYLNQQAKQQAKEEALDKYYQDQVASISSKGLRDVDMNYFGQKYKELQNLYMQNKDAIKNPTKYGFEKAQEYNQRRQELMNLPSISKQAQDEKAQALKLSMNPANREILDMKTFDESLKLHDLPINDPRRKSVDLANPPYLPKLLSPNELNSYYTGHLQRLGTDATLGKAQDIGNYKQKRVLTEEYSPDNLLKAAKQVQIEAQSNPSLRRTAKEQFQFASDEEKTELANIYKKYFGKTMEDGQDIMAAQFIQKGLAAKKSTEKIEDNFWAKSQLSLNNSRTKLASNLNKPNQQQGNLFDVIGGEDAIPFSGGKTLKNGMVTMDKDGTPFNGNIYIPKEKIPSGVYSSLKASGVNDMALLGNKGFDARIKDGRIIGLTDKIIGYIDRQGMENAQLKSNTEPLKGDQPDFGNKSLPPIQQPSNKKPTSTKGKVR